VPVQVSYKKQFALFFLLTLTLLVAVEVVVNIWLNFFYQCGFEDNEIFKNVDPETNRKICLESFAYGFTKDRISWIDGTRPLTGSGLDENLVYINSQGFRGPEFSEIKSENTYRIIIVGGSTAFGVGVLDNQTFPYYLQNIFDKSNLNFNVEVINSAWTGLYSLLETELIKDRLINFGPDLFIVYDGWNELDKQVVKLNPEASPELWKERWIEICDLGKQHGFDTIVTLQPMVNTGQKILSEQEYESYIEIENKKITVPYPQYIKQLDELKNHCTLTADFRGIFDNIRESIYFDIGHTGPKGNKIIAEKFYQISLPIIIKGSNNINLENYNDESYLNDSNKQIKLNDYDLFFEQYRIFLKENISHYKTPRVIPLIFQ